MNSPSPNPGVTFRKARESFAKPGFAFDNPESAFRNLPQGFRVGEIVFRKPRIAPPE